MPEVCFENMGRLNLSYNLKGAVLDEIDKIGKNVSFAFPKFDLGVTNLVPFVELPPVDVFGEMQTVKHCSTISKLNTLNKDFHAIVHG